METVAERRRLVLFELDTAPGVSRLEADHVALDGTALGRAAANHAADAVFAKKSKARSEPLWIGLSAFDPLSGYDPNAEGWQFPPLTEVRCVKRKFMVGTDQLGFKLNFYRHLTSAQTALNRAQAQ
jgi:hypothetical protein